MLQTRHSPIIVGERYELAETLSHGGENGGGLLAKPDFQTAMLSLSGYDKHAASEMDGYDSRKTSQPYSTPAEYNPARTVTDGSYYLYSSNGLAESHAQVSSTSYGRNVEQVSYGTNPIYQPRTMYESAQSGFNEYGVHKTPVVESYHPTRGNRGTRVDVIIRSDYNLLANPPLVVSVMFGSHRVPASLSHLESASPQYEFVVTTTAPNFSETSSSNTQLQLQIKLQEQSGQDAGILNVGYFQYIASVLGSSPQSQEGMKKRRLSMESTGSTQQSTDEYSFTSNAGYAYPQGLHSVATSSMQRRYTPYGRAQNKFRDITSRRGTQGLSMDSTTRSLMRPPHSQSTAFSPSYSHISSGRSDGSASSANPPLIRTSTLHQSPSSAPAGPSAGASFNLYPMYGQKAVLKLKGNLNSMTEDWTSEEWAAKRRLVQFFRSRDGCTVNAQFAPVKPEDRQPNSITISCIWWEERQECFATSVDTIALLEQLVDSRFTVEEKNRIRRNLEGFKPLTVAKGKADSEEFFKVIMGFPNPKPRNIEKDVKVFEWKILAGALKKIMSKYSASNSSTAGPLQGTRTSGFNDYASDATADRYAHVSSRSASNSTSSSNYASTLKSNLPSPVEALPSQYSSEATSHSGLSQNYMSPSLPTQFTPHDPIHQTSPPIGHLGPNSYHDTTPMPNLTHNYTSSALERSRSQQEISSYDDTRANRYNKRPRASTSSASGLYHPDETASAYQQASRSFSEQPDHRGSLQLPSLSEDFAVQSSAEGMFLQPQPQPSQTSSLLTTPAPGPYDY